MNIVEFNNMPEVENFDELIDPVVGTRFLYGRAMLNQKDVAEVGKEVSFYEVISIKEGGKNMEYCVRFDRLERLTQAED